MQEEHWAHLDIHEHAEQLMTGAYPRRLIKIKLCFFSDKHLVMAPSTILVNKGEWEDRFWGSCVFTR